MLKENMRKPKGVFLTADTLSEHRSLDKLQVSIFWSLVMNNSYGGFERSIESSTAIDLVQGGLNFAPGDRSRFLR